MGSWPREAPPTAVPRFDDVESDQSLWSLIDATLSFFPHDDDLLRMREQRRRDAEASHSPDAEVEDDSHMVSPADVAGDEASEADAPGIRRSKRSRKAPDVYGDFAALEECERTDGEKRRRYATKEEAQAAKRALDAKYAQSKKRKDSQAKWRQSKKGKDSQAKYAQSKKGKDSKAKYAQSKKRKDSQAKWRQSKKGKDSKAKWRESKKGKDSKAKYAQSKKGKDSKAKYQKSEKGKDSNRASSAKYQKSEKWKKVRKRRTARTAMVKNAEVVAPHVQRSLRGISKPQDITIKAIGKSLVKKKIDPQTAQSVELSRASPHHIGDASARTNVDEFVQNILEQKVNSLLDKFSSVGHFSSAIRETSLLQLLTCGRYCVYVGYTADSLEKEAFAFVARPGKKLGSKKTLYGRCVLEYTDRPDGRKHARPTVKDAREKLGFVSFSIGTFEDAIVALNVEAALQAVVSHAKSYSRYLGIRLFRELTKAPSVFPATFEREDRLPTVFVTVAEIDLERSKFSRCGDSLITLNGHAMRVVK